MEEIICAGTVEVFAHFIDALRFKNALFLAEEFPRHVIRKPAERKQLLRFDFLGNVSAEDRLRYTSGRIFTKEAELRWEKKGEDSYDVIYFGPSIELEGIDRSRQESISEELYEREPKSYYLFGQRLDKERHAPMEIAISDEAYGERLYAEVRIPRLLYYPWTTQPGIKQDRVQLEVLEYRKKDTSQVMFYRFQDVKPAE